VVRRIRRQVSVGEIPNCKLKSEKWKGAVTAPFLLRGAERSRLPIYYGSPYNDGIREDWLLLFLYLCVERNVYRRHREPMLYSAQIADVGEEKLFYLTKR
jgi:hypothetical protein